ncbi:MAG: rhodanese-like domain-containing protein [Minwuia sp.]|nr:rhodanese-like domain-containing protein [Minwuia sp.]
MKELRLHLLILLLLMPLPASADVAVLSPDRAWEEARSGQVLIIDVRNAPEWAWTGVPRGAARASWWQIGGEGGFLEDVLALVSHDRDRAIALICARGVRSSDAAAFLRANGFSSVRDIGEGMLGSAEGPGWLKRQLPLE